MASAAVKGLAGTRQRQQVAAPGWAPRHRRCRCRLAAQAGLLDLLRGAGSTEIATDAEGEELKAWLIERGLPPPKVGSTHSDHQLPQAPAVSE